MLINSYHIKEIHGNYETLFHVPNIPIEQIIVEGFDIRLAKTDYFGRGIYFSDPLKCSLQHKKDMPCAMLMCSVVIGSHYRMANGVATSSIKLDIS